MSKTEITQRIVLNHNRLVSIFASGGVMLQNADSVIMMGDIIRDLRDMAQTLQGDINKENNEEPAHAGEEKTGEK